MIAVIFATGDEAAPFLSLLRPVGDGAQGPNFPVYHGHLSTAPQVTLGVAVCGMGPEAALAAARHFAGIDGVQAIFNGGICGALQDAAIHGPGAVFAVTRVCGADGEKGLWAAKPQELAAGRPDLPRARLVTVSAPVFDARRRRRLARDADLVDMEGAPIAWVAARRGIACRLIKGVTDRAVAGARRALQQNLNWVSRRVAEVLAEGIRAWGAGSRTSGAEERSNAASITGGIAQR
jgi:adenosylhomocysteine nucleosidase